MMLIRLITLPLLILSASFSIQAHAEPAHIYNDALSLAASGDEHASVSKLTDAARLLHVESIWRERMLTAATLIQMRAELSIIPQFTQTSVHKIFAEVFIEKTPAPKSESSWEAGVMATIVPGAGHLWLGRAQDAFTAALLVWPMIALTLWAGFRRMGPVTLFFALITAWLWSGTVYSAISLAEREAMEAYLIWWQGLWQASGLPGRPW